MYMEFAPNQKLKPLVECFWRSRTEVSSIRRVLPDGCVDLIFDLSPGRETAFWVGTMTRPLVIDGCPRDLLGIRFHPGGAKGLLDLPLRELKDERVSIQCVTPSIEESLDSLDIDKRAPFESIQRWLESKLVAHASFPLVSSIFRQVKTSPGNVRVGELAASLDLSRQYLNRFMSDHVGVDLKTFIRIIRMRACTGSLCAKGRLADWSAVAAEFGFYDQSHMIHDFKELVGLSPGQFLAS